MDAIGQRAAADATKRIFQVKPGLNGPAAPVSAVKWKITSVCAVAVFSACVCVAQPYFVSPAGDDVNPGTLEKPFATLQRAQQAARQKRGNVFLRGGTYYLPATLVFTAQDSGTQDAAVDFPELSRRESGRQRRRPAQRSRLAALHERNFSGESPGGFADRGNFRQRRASDSGALSELRSRRRNISTGSHQMRTSSSAPPGGRIQPEVTCTQCTRPCGEISPGVLPAKMRTAI